MTDERKVPLVVKTPMSCLSICSSVPISLAANIFPAFFCMTDALFGGVT